LDPLYQRAQELLKKAREAGVVGCLVPSYGPSQWDRQTELLQLQGVVNALGIHPWCIQDCDPDSVLEQLRTAFESLPPKWGDGLVAVGEFGLDRSSTPLKRCFKAQQDLFAVHLEWANTRNLPVIIHLVKAFGHGYELLSQDPPLAGGVIHSYSGSQEMIPRFSELDLYFSYSARLQRCEKSRRNLRATPPERLLFETDAPDPNSIRSGDCSGPEALPQVVEAASEVLGQSIPWCRERHRENWHRLFSR